MRPTRGSLFLVSLVFFGCGDGEAGSDVEALPQQWEVERVARIGSLDDPEQSLTFVTQALIGPEDELYVLQQREAQIRVYDARGALVGTIGRQGQGPGEFNAPSRMGFMGDTLLYVGDNSLGRVTFFPLAGGEPSTLRWTTTMAPSAPGTGVVFMAAAPQLLLPDGSALLKPTAVVVGGGQAVRAPYLRVFRDSDRADTIAWEGAVGADVVWLPTVPSETFGFPNPFPAHLLSEIHADGSGVVLVDRDVQPAEVHPEFEVIKIGPQGDTLWARSYAFQPVPLSDEVVRRVTNETVMPRLTAVAQGRGEAVPSVAVAEGAVRESRSTSGILPPISALQTGQDGSIWLRLADGPNEGVPWLVLDSDGELVGRVTLPSRQRIAAARGDLIAAIESDDLDVPYVLLYRVRR